MRAELLGTRVVVHADAGRGRAAPARAGARGPAARGLRGRRRRPGRRARLGGRRARRRAGDRRADQHRLRRRARRRDRAAGDAHLVRRRASRSSTSTTASARARSPRGSRARPGAPREPGPLPRLRRPASPATCCSARCCDAGADPSGSAPGWPGSASTGSSCATEPADAARDHARRTRRSHAAPGQPHRDWRSIRALIDAAGPAGAGARARAGGVRAARPSPRRGSTTSSPSRCTSTRSAPSTRSARCAASRSRSRTLGVDRVVCSPLPVGRGFVKAAHGRLPLPAPATLALLEGAPIYGVEVETELVTPTGAALVAALADGYGPLPRLTLEAAGYGAGTRDLEASCRTSSARSSAPRPGPPRGRSP